jgi:antitoxin component HigA of HigAB toxin-antitoxin module
MALRVSKTAKPIVPIRDEAGHRAALVEIEELWGAEPGTAEDDRLNVLISLVDDYERTNWPDEDLDPVDAIHARMENSGRSRKDFEQIIGSSGRASDILNRKRHLTLPMIWRLVRDWWMSAEVLVRPYELTVERTAKRDTKRARAVH